MASDWIRSPNTSSLADTEEDDEDFFIENNSDNSSSSDSDSDGSQTSASELSGNAPLSAGAGCPLVTFSSK